MSKSKRDYPYLYIKFYILSTKSGRLPHAGENGRENSVLLLTSPTPDETESNEPSSHERERCWFRNGRSSDGHVVHEPVLSRAGRLELHRIDAIEIDRRRNETSRRERNRDGRSHLVAAQETRDRDVACSGAADTGPEREIRIHEIEFASRCRDHQISVAAVVDSVVWPWPRKDGSTVDTVELLAVDDFPAIPGEPIIRRGTTPQAAMPLPEFGVARSLKLMMVSAEAQTAIKTTAAKTTKNFLKVLFSLIL